jgi:hypothetical protein
VEGLLRQRREQAETGPDEEIAGEEEEESRRGLAAGLPLASDPGEEQHHRGGRWQHHGGHHDRPHEPQLNQFDSRPRRRRRHVHRRHGVGGAHGARHPDQGEPG